MLGFLVLLKGVEADEDSIGFVTFQDIFDMFLTVGRIVGLNRGLKSLSGIVIKHKLVTDLGPNQLVV